MQDGLRRRLAWSVPQPAQAMTRRVTAGRAGAPARRRAWVVLADEFACGGDRAVSAGRRIAAAALMRHHPERQPGQAQTAAEGGVGPRATRRHGHANQRPLHSRRGHGCGCQQGGLAQLARREVELGLPGLLRRTHSVGVTPAAPTPGRAVPPRRHEPTQGRWSPTPHRWCRRLRRGRSEPHHLPVPPAHSTWSPGLLALGGLSWGWRGRPGCWPSRVLAR
jgi:hypothetical protein